MYKTKFAPIISVFCVILTAYWSQFCILVVDILLLLPNCQIDAFEIKYQDPMMMSVSFHTVKLIEAVVSAIVYVVLRRKVPS